MKLASKLSLVVLVVCGATACTDSKPVATPAVSVAPVKVTIPNWGPQGTKAGQGFAVQTTGNSAIWFEQRGIGSAESVEVWFGDTKLGGMAISPNVGGSAEVPPALYAKPGSFPVYLMLKPQNQRVDVGLFVVSP